MKKAFVLLLALIVFISCQNTHNKNSVRHLNKVDSLKDMATIQHEVDSIVAAVVDSVDREVDKQVNNEQNKSIFISQNECPVKITKSWLTENSIGSPEANLNIKNCSSRVIDGIKVGILCYNNFDEPINKNSIYGNEFSGISQEKLSPGRTASWTWTMNLFDNTTKINPYIKEVHFKDGTKWPTK